MTQSKQLGLFSIILLGINTIVGSGIFLLPGQVAALAGSWSLIVYAFATLIILSIAWCFSQCAALFNKDGGAYLYAKHAFGDFVGFEIGIMRWAIGIISWASLAVAFVTALSAVWPSALQEPYRTIIILSIIGGLGLLNIFNTNAMKFLNNTITIAKLIPIVFFIGIGIFYLESSNIVVELPYFEAQTFGGATLLLFYAFAGFESLVVAAGEMKNPQKNLPIAVMTIICICAFLYVLIQLIAMGILGASLETSVTPMADVAEMILGPKGKFAIVLAMLISIGGVNVATSFLVPKNGVALASDGMIPAVIARKSKQGTPYIAIFITVVATSVMALTGDFVQLVAISAVARFAQHISTSLAVYVFYKGQLTWKHRIIPIVALSGVVWLIFQTPVYQLVIGLAALFVSIPFYFMRKTYVRIDSLDAKKI